MDNVRGSFCMVFAMACFSLEDAFIKATAQTMTLGEILVIFGFFGTAIFMLLTRQRGEKIFHPALLSRAIVIRTLCEIVGRSFFSISIVLIPLTTLSAMLQATPLIVVTGAAIFFNEKIGWRRWTAVSIGFIGVLLVIRPGAESFQLVSLFGVLGTLGFAFRDLATRASPKALSNIQLGVYGFFILMPIGLIIMYFDKDYSGSQLPSLITIAQLTGTIIFGTTAYYFINAAMRLGEVAVVAPFRYTRILFALAIGIIIFKEQPDSLTLIGCMIVVASGIYTLFRSKVTEKEID